MVYGNNGTYKLSNSSRPYTFRAVSGEIPDEWNKSVIKEKILSNVTTVQAPAQPAPLLINVTDLNSSLPSKRWFVSQAYDDLTRELKFNEDNSFDDLSRKNVRGRWEVDQNGTTAQITIRFNVNGDKAVFQVNQTDPYLSLNVLRTERDSLLKAMLFELPPGAVPPKYGNRPVTDDHTAPIRSLNQTIQAAESAMTANNWYYGRNTADQNYPLKFTADKKWKAVNDRDNHGTWKIEKDMGVLILTITFDNEDKATYELTGLEPLTYSMIRSQRYGMDGSKIYSQEKPVVVSANGFGHEVGDIVDSLESLMVGKSWIAGNSSFNSVTDHYVFFPNHTYATDLRHDISGKWELENNGTVNVLTMTQLLEVGNGSFIEEGTIRYEMTEGTDLVQFRAVESSWVERKFWVLQQNDTIRTAQLHHPESSLMIGKNFSAGLHENATDNKYTFFKNGTFKSVDNGNGTWAVKIDNSTTHLLLNQSSKTANATSNKTEYVLVNSKGQLKFKNVLAEANNTMVNWTLVEDHNATLKKLNASTEELDSVLADSDWFAGEVETSTDHPWKFYSNKTFVTEKDNNTGNWTVRKVGGVTQLKLKWENGGSATFDLAQAKPIVKFKLFSSNFKHMRSWRLW